MQNDIFEAARFDTGKRSDIVNEGISIDPVRYFILIARVRGMRKNQFHFYFMIVIEFLLFWQFGLMSDANALPAFARKYDVACTLCHTAFPKLNDFGVNFRDNGYQMGTESDLPTNESLGKGYFPLSFRTSVGYLYANQDAVQGKSGNRVGNYTSGLGSLNMDFLSAGLLDKDISFLVVPTGETSLLGGSATFQLESAWIRLDNLAGSSLLNLKVGKGDLDIPFSEHRSLTFETPYVVYHYVPGTPYNSSGTLPVGDATSTSLATFDTFALGDHQGLLSLMGHTGDSLGIFRYSVDLVSNNQYGGHDLGYYLHVTQALFGGGYSSGYRGGLFYLDMPMPTTYDNSAGSAAGNIGSGSKPSLRYGVDLSGNFFNNRLNLFGVYLLGQDDKGLIPGATDNAKFWGGFVEANFMPDPKWMLIGRYDLVRNTTEPMSQIAPSGCSSGATSPNCATIPALISSEGYDDVDSYTIAVRYALVVHNRGEIWVHSEFNETLNKKTAFDGTDQTNDLFFLGLDFAF